MPYIHSKTRICSFCGNTNCFFLQVKDRDGDLFTTYKCRECRHEYDRNYYEAHRHRKLELHANWYKNPKNKKRVMNWQRAYRAKKLKK